MSLAKELKHEESIALDFSEIKRILAGRVKNLKVGFVDLESGFNDHDLLKRSQVLVLMTANVSGNTQRHWGVLTHNKKGLFFYESLGMGVKVIRRIINTPSFADWLVKHKAKVNTFKHQKDSHAVRTCSLHCICRVVKKDLSNKEYNHWLHSVPLTPDMTVSLITYLGHKT